MFVGTFPLVSETFVVRQITGLLDAGHHVDIFADFRGPEGPVHPEVGQYGLLRRTLFMDMPEETAPWEMPVTPWYARTWRPGSEIPVWNGRRIVRALPALARCLVRAPRLTRRVLSRDEYGFQAESLSSLYRLDRMARSGGAYDVLHAQFGPTANSFRFARELFRAPLVVTFHGYDFSTLPRTHGPDLYRSLFGVADAVTVNSDYTRQQVLPLGCPEESLHRLPMGVDLGKFLFRERRQEPGEPFRILTIARLVPIKGIEVAIRAVAILWQRHPDMVYDLVGDGPSREHLERLVQELDLDETVRFHGACEGATLHRRLAEGHVFVLPSVTVEGDREGQGLVVQEAQACGLPVLVTDHGGLPQGLLPGASGFVVPENDANALADRLEYLISHPEDWPAMGRAGRRLVETEFDNRLLVDRLVEVYRAAGSRYRDVPIDSGKAGRE
jgi:colanic acid/amylovoran biosynthesis glycosyltransferase